MRPRRPPGAPASARFGGTRSRPVHDEVRRQFATTAHSGRPPHKSPRTTPAATEPEPASDSEAAPKCLFSLRLLFLLLLLALSAAEAIWGSADKWRCSCTTYCWCCWCWCWCWCCCCCCHRGADVVGAVFEHRVRFIHPVHRFEAALEEFLHVRRAARLPPLPLR